MLSVTNEYKRQLIAGNRNWKIKVPVFLASNQTQTPDFTLTNSEIWEQGIVIDQATSDDSSFDIGSAIIGSLKVVINNIRGNFSQYDFYDAKLTLWLGVEGDVDEHDEQVYYRIGFYSVDTPSYNGSLITLDCLDNMTWFDVPFEDVTGITYPTTAGALVGAICSHVGVTLGDATFPNYTTQISVAPTEQLNCREVLQYVAQMCCCYCKINRAGQLILAWYDKSAIIGQEGYDGGTYSTDTTPYSDGDSLDGGTFAYNDGDDADGGDFSYFDGAFLGHNFEIEVSTDDIVVTGCRVFNNTSEEDSYDELVVDSELEQDHERYVLVIENNPFITASNASAIATQVADTLAGLPIRAYTATSLADFSYETGDPVDIRDFRGNDFYTWITHFTFTTNNSEQFSCGAQSLKKARETRYSDSIKTLAEANANASAQLSDYDNAVKAMNELAQNAIGYNKYQYVISGATVTWLYSGSQITTTDPANPKFPNSTTVFKITGDGVFISHDGGNTYDSGYDANSGTAILSLIYAVGLNADWINTGTLKVGGSSGNVNGKIEVYDSSDNLLGRWSKDGVEINSSYTYTEQGVTYNRGMTIKDGHIEYKKSISSYPEASIEMETWGVNQPTNLTEYATGYVAIYSGYEKTSGGYSTAATLSMYGNDSVYAGMVDLFSIGDIRLDGKSIQLKSDPNRNVILDTHGDLIINASTDSTDNWYSGSTGSVLTALHENLSQSLSRVCTGLSINFNTQSATWWESDVSIYTYSASTTNVKKGIVC